LEGMALTLAPHLIARDAAQFRVHDRQQPV
jgi:hypothetical protein